MEKTTLRAHFDGRHILLDDPIELQPNTKLLVTVLPESANEERRNWERLSLETLARAYGDDEPEYALHLIKESNPDYERR